MPVSPCETGGASETHRWGAKFFAAARDDWRDKGLAEWGARPGKSIMHRQSVAMDVPVGARRPLSMPLRCSGREAIVHAELLMSRLAALGQTATSRQVRVVSDLAPIADVRRGVPNVGFVPVIGIGGSLAAPPLPHHRTYGSVYGGSRSYANALRSNDSHRRFSKLHPHRQRFE